MINQLDLCFKKLNINYFHILMQVYNLIVKIMIMEYLKSLVLNVFLMQKILAHMILLELCYKNYMVYSNQLIFLGKTMEFLKDLTNLNLLILTL